MAKKTEVGSGALQQFRDETDINRIMRRVRNNGLQLNMDMSKFQYTDTTAIPDFLGINNKMIEARESFLRLPNKVRKHFDHNPINFLSFISDPRNQKEAEELGLLEKKAEPKPDIQESILSELKKMNDGKPSGTPST